jgi:hypothetical protein
MEIERDRGKEREGGRERYHSSFGSLTDDSS